MLATTPAHLLVVDDSEANRDLLSRRLQRQGHTVSLAENGHVALEMMRAATIDLVLLDLMMPVLSGFDVLERLKADAALRHVPVIMISASEDVDGIARCIELGAEDYLPKPFNPVILRARVEASLEKKRLRDRDRLYALSMRRELEIGREIQAGFLPETLPSMPGWEIAARFRAAHQVSGDFYDAFELGPGRLGIVIADICDKGVGAALFMALFRTLIRSTASEQPQGAGGDTAAACLRRTIGATNDYIARTHSRANMFATVFFAVVEVETGTMMYINGGHEPPVIAGDGVVKARLEPTGPAVGLMPDAEFAVAAARLEPGDTLVAFTDGASEARSPDGVLFGDDRVVALCACRSRSADEVLARLEAAVHAHAGEAEQSDDIALLAVQRAWA